MGINTMEPEKITQIKQPKFRVRFLLLPIPIILGFVAFGLGFGCGLGGGDDFTCRMAAPAFLLGVFVSVVTLILIFITPFPKRVSKVVSTLFAASVIIPVILLLLPNILPQSTSVKYLEGITPEVCTTQKSIVPWGKTFISRDGCYSQFDMCDKVQDHYSEQMCYARTTTFRTYSDCGVFKNWNNKLDCEVAVAESEKDLNFCSSITVPTIPTGSAVRAPDPSYVYFARHDCVMKVSGFGDEISKEVVRHDNSNNWMQAAYCKDYTSVLATDLCYAQTAYRHQADVGLCAKISNTLPWLKKNCEGVSDLKP